MDWLEKIKALGPCHEAVEWLETQPDAQTAWNNCERPDWMLWLLGNRAGGPRSKSRKRLVLLACECARTTLRYVRDGDDRPRRAIETAESWARGENGVTLKHVKVADAAAYAAYSAADAADAAYSASNAAYAAYASNASNASNAAYASNASNAANAAAVSNDCAMIRRALIAIIRNHVPTWREFGTGAWVRKDGE